MDKLEGRVKKPVALREGLKEPSPIPKSRLGQSADGWISRGTMAARSTSTLQPMPNIASLSESCLALSHSSSIVPETLLVVLCPCLQFCPSQGSPRSTSKIPGH